MKPEIKKKMEQCMETQQLHLSNMNISDTDIQEILDEMGKLFPTLTVLNLDNNKLTNKAASLLGRELVKYSSLIELSLQFNNIENQGAIDVFSLKNSLPQLDILFHGNKITNVSEMAEIECLATDRSGLKMK